MGALLGRPAVEDRHGLLRCAEKRPREERRLFHEEEVKKLRGHSVLRRLRLEVGGKVFVSSPLTLQALGPSYFDLLLDDSELAACLNGEVETLPPLDFECPMAFARFHSSAQLARTDLPGALKQLGADLAGDHGGTLRALLQRLELEWTLGHSAPMPERLQGSSSAAVVPCKCSCSLEEWLSGEAQGLAGVLASLVMKPEAELPTRYAQADAICNSWDLHTEEGVVHFSEELNRFASTHILSSLRNEATGNLIQVARITACAALRQRKQLEDFPAYAPQLSELALLERKNDERRYEEYILGPPDYYNDYNHDPAEAPEPFPGMAEVGLRRLVFDFGPERLLLLEGALLVLDIKAPRTWRQADVLMASASDLSDDVDTLAALVTLNDVAASASGSSDHIDAVKRCRIGPVASPGCRPCGRMFSITLIPWDYPRHALDYRPGENAFSWSLKAVEFYGRLLDVPEKLRPRSSKPPFMFNSSSEQNFVRIAARE